MFREKNSASPLKPPGSNSPKLKGMVKRTYPLPPTTPPQDAPQKAGAGEGRRQPAGDVRFMGVPVLGRRIEESKSEVQELFSDSMTPPPGAWGQDLIGCPMSG